MKTYFIILLFIYILFCQNKSTKFYDEKAFSYSLLAVDSLRTSYIDLSSVKLVLTSKYNFRKEESISLQKFQIDENAKIFIYKHNFSSIDKLTKIRDAVELYGQKVKIDSLYYGKDYYKKPYIFSSLINVGKFDFRNHNYIAFFIQDISNPVTFPNTLILLFDVTNKNDITYIPIGFQASEDLKCFNDFNKDGVLDFAKWTQGYDFSKYLYRYELNDKNKFVPKKADFVLIKEKKDGYYIDVFNSKWEYGILNN